MEQSKLQDRWFTVIFDIAVRIPVNNFRIGPVTVGRKPPVLVARDGELQVDVAEPYVKQQRSTYEFTTRSYYWIGVWASNGDAASDYVRHHVDPFVSALLSYQAGFEVLTRPAAVQVENESPALLSPAIIQCSSVEYKVPALDKLYSSLAEDKCLSRATGALRRGRHLMSVNDEPARRALMDMGLFQTFQCLESLANDKRHQIRQPDEIGAGPAQRAAIIGRLRKKLEEGEQSSAVQAIDHAKQQLFQLDGYTLQKKVKSLAAWLKLDKSWLAGGIKLAKARNENLGHNGKLLNDDMRQDLLAGRPGQTPAVQVAEDALLAFAVKISTASDQPGTTRGSALVHPVEDPVTSLDWSRATSQIDIHEDPRMRQYMLDEMVVSQTLQDIASGEADPNPNVPRR